MKLERGVADIDLPTNAPASPISILTLRASPFGIYFAQTVAKSKVNKPAT